VLFKCFELFIPIKNQNPWYQRTIVAGNVVLKLVTCFSCFHYDNAYLDPLLPYSALALVCAWYNVKEMSVGRNDYNVIPDEYYLRERHHRCFFTHFYKKDFLSDVLNLSNEYLSNIRQ
jgi:hypothetical protein